MADSNFPWVAKPDLPHKSDAHLSPSMSVLGSVIPGIGSMIFRYKGIPVIMHVMPSR